MRSSASSQVIRSKRPSPLGPTRRSGVVSRPGPCTKSGYSVWTLVQSTPAVSGLAREPRTLTTRSFSTVTVRLHVSGQSRGQTLGLSAIMGPPGSGALYRSRAGFAACGRSEPREVSPAGRTSPCPREANEGKSPETHDQQQQGRRFRDARRPRDNITRNHVVDEPDRGRIDGKTGRQVEYGNPNRKAHSIESVHHSVGA